MPLIPGPGDTDQSQWVLPLRSSWSGGRIVKEKTRRVYQSGLGLWKFLGWLVFPVELEHTLPTEQSLRAKGAGGLQRN